MMAKNFLPFKDIELNLENQGLVLIEGENLTSNKYKSNGSGKSSLFQIFVYAVFDTTTNGLKADEVINLTERKNTVVAVEGYIGEDHYRIERYRKHSKYKNKVRLLLNGKDISEKSVADTNTKIQQVIGMDYTTFINSIMFSQGNGAGRFALATDKEKKDIFDNLVQLQIYGKAQTLAKAKIKDKDQAILTKKQNEEQFKWELDQVDKLEAQDKTNYTHTQMLISEAKVKKDRIWAQLTNWEEYHVPKIHTLNQEVENLVQQREAIISKNLTKETNKLNDLYRDLQDKQTQKKQLQAQKENIVNQYHKVQQDTNCPVCGNELDPIHRQQELDNLKGQLREILLQLQDIEPQITQATEAYNLANTIYEEERQVQNNVNQTYRKLTEEAQKREKEVNYIDNAHRDFQIQLESATVSYEQLQGIPKPQSRDDERNTIRGKIKAVRDEILALEKERNQLEDVVKVYSNSGVKSHVLDLVTPFLNERANKYISALSGTDMEVLFSTQTQNKSGEMAEKFDVQLKNAKGGGLYKANSEGEKKRADLSIALALQDFVLTKGESQTNFVVYDEVFDALDAIGSENVITLLKERLETTSSIFVITHNETLKNLFEKVITVTKHKDGISTLEKGAETS